MPVPQPLLAPLFKQPVMTRPPGNWNPVHPQMQVPGQFEMNAKETGRVIRQMHVQQNVYPSGSRLKYTNVPVTITCQYCHSKVVTEVKSDCHLGTFFLMFLIFILCFPCGVFVFCGGLFKKYWHICPKCKKVVGET